MQQTSRPGAIPLALLSALIFGCARPGPPRPPSLHIPAAVTDLSAARSGNTVELHFTVPRRATDGVPLPATDLRGTLCRQLDASSNCVAVGSLTAPTGSPSSPPITLHDALPPELTTGPPRLLTYRVELFNKSDTSAGRSEPAYSVAGPAPSPVEGLTLAGARNGIVLTWKPADPALDDVLLEREDLSPRPVKAASVPAARPHVLTVPHHATKHAVATPQPTSSPNTLWLQANADSGNRTLDATADPDTPYRYRALRRRFVQLGGRKLELRSAPSSPLEITLLEIYPPAVPTGLNVAAYFDHPGQPQAPFAVDLVWQPVDDDSRTAPLAGYNIYRETLNAQGKVLTPRASLNPTPTLLPAFHDPTARPSDRYRYGVTAIDTKGNQSEAATTLLEPQPTP